jgi:hypothetical protein
MALVPVVSSFPSSRLLMVGLVGFAPLVASFVVDAIQRVRQRDPAPSWRAWLVAGVAVLFGLYHLVVPAAISHAEVKGLGLAARNVRASVLGMEADQRLLPNQRVVILAAVEDGTSMYLPLTRQHYGLAAPKRCWTLSRSFAPFTLKRVGPKSITIRFAGRFSMLNTAPERLLRTPRAPMRVGHVVDLDGMRATVLELDDDRPTAVRFDFDVPLEDPSLLFVHPMPRGIVRFPIPAVGKSVEVPPPVIPALSQ